MSDKDQTVSKNNKDDEKTLSTILGIVADTYGLLSESDSANLHLQGISNVLKNSKTDKGVMDTVISLTILGMLDVKRESQVSHA